AAAASASDAGAVAPREPRERLLPQSPLLDIRTLFHHNADGLICPKNQMVQYFGPIKMVQSTTERYINTPVG
ncbi:MAG: hypothetical protein IJX37_01070, partial [Oscillospiraceae bacterium]|nr:hypothetical protein [Oscillospiraceae bacterium]